MWLQTCSRIYEPITIHLVVTKTGSQCRILYIKTKQGHCGKSGRENAPSSSLQRTAFCRTCDRGFGRFSNTIQMEYSLAPIQW